LKTLGTFLLTASEEMLAILLLFKNIDKSISENDQTSKDQKEEKESKVDGPKASKRDQKEEKDSKVDGPKENSAKGTKRDVMDNVSDTKGFTSNNEKRGEKSKRNRRRRGKSKPKEKKLQIENRKAGNQINNNAKTSNIKASKKKRESISSKGTSIEAI